MKKNIFSLVGILIYILMVFIDRVFYKIPDCIYVPIALSLIIMIIIGFIVDNKRKNKSNNVE